MPFTVGLPRAETSSTAAATPVGSARSEARAEAARERGTQRDGAPSPAASFGDAMTLARRTADREAARRADDAGLDAGSARDDATRAGHGRDGDAGGAQDATRADADADGGEGATADTGQARQSPVHVPVDVALHAGEATVATAIAPGSGIPLADEAGDAARDHASRAVPSGAAAPPTPGRVDPASAASVESAAVASTAAAAPCVDPHARGCDTVARPARPAGATHVTTATDADAPGPGASNPAASASAAPGARRHRAGDEAVACGAAGLRPDLAAHLGHMGARGQPVASDANPSFALPHVSVTSGATHPAPAGLPPVLASVPTPLGHPGFADRFADAIGALALRGVERAEIVLNPRELGPVRIELSLNGESARIAFSAAQPETRHAIEQTLPVLKDLLANHGLTLSDTSVSDGRAGRDPGSGFGSGRSPAPTVASAAIGADGGAPHSAAIRRPVGLRGLVDLYA